MSEPDSPRCYRVFKRSARNWREFASARKYTVRTRLTHAEALRMCDALNAELTAPQIKRGTKYEFTS